MSANEKGPIELREAIQKTLILNTKHDLRSNNTELVKTERVYTKYGDLMFHCFGAKLINNIKSIDFKGEIKEMINTLKLNINITVDKFITLFERFKLDMNFSFYKKTETKLNIAFF